MAQSSAIASTVPEEIDEFEETLGQEEAEELRLAEVEARARRQGWRPLAEYRGEAGKWVDAETFLDRGEKFLPFVQKQLRESNERAQRMEGEITSLKTDLTEARQVLQEVRQFALNANEAGYTRARREIEAEKRAAVAEGDTVAYDAAAAKLSALEEGRQEREAPPPPPPERPKPTPQVQTDPAVEQFVAENPWFNSDPQLNGAMQGHHMTIKAAQPGLTLAQNLAEAKRRVMADFPEKFGLEAGQGEEEEVQQPQPRRPSSPAPPSRSAPAPRRGAQGFDRIADAAERDTVRKAYARMKRHDPTLTVEDYLTIYENPHADVLDMRNSKKAKS